jgi:hypothetical protein
MNSSDALDAAPLPFAAVRRRRPAEPRAASMCWRVGAGPESLGLPLLHGIGSC